MTGFWHGKLKRKDLEEVYDDFAEFSLSSPARKIRRLVSVLFLERLPGAFLCSIDLIVPDPFVFMLKVLWLSVGISLLSVCVTLSL
ncbi:hypothetical protein B296_00022640 [Ensete ventricosum]|uniref:Uncharacterized protein n=1 Tax=Ensete ventricosum TaxID=4639 RepID=A0A426Y300_ENSVE|nr:hypothetical protein B296_00022640 [Ensete ventricosum]